MKKYIALLLIVFSIGSVASFTLLNSQAHAAPGVRVPLIRLYNSKTNDHLYTSSRVEATQAGSVGYRTEGEMGYLYEQGQLNGQHEALLYRLLNPRNGKHFYTTSGQESAAASAAGYVSEGIVGVLPGSTTEYSLDIFRLYNRKQNKHFYTTNVSERDVLLGAGFVSEGTLAGVLFTSSTGSSSNIPTPTVQTDFIMTSSSFAMFTPGVYRTANFSFQYKGSNGAQPVAAFSSVPSGLAGGMVTPSVVNNNDTFTVPISGTISNSTPATVQITLYAGNGYSETFGIEINPLSQGGAISGALSANDTKRVKDAITIQDAVSSYYYNQPYTNGNYNPSVVPVLPASLDVLMPLYLSSIPMPPAAEGPCTVQQNNYIYRKLTSNSYSVSLCTGAAGTYDGEYITAGYHEFVLTIHN